jgi:hypothetical protein
MTQFVTSKATRRPTRVLVWITLVGAGAGLAGCAPTNDPTLGSFLGDLLRHAMAAFLL